MPDAPSQESNDFPNYFGVAPHPQNALDLFKGEWSTRLPDACGLVASTGPARLLEDYRVEWAAQQLGGFAGKNIVELGPMEGGHAYMLDKMQAKAVTSIEASSRAYLKCLITKEIFGITRARFLLGDFTQFLETTPERYDVGLACGVLYHLANPVHAIELLAQRCASVFVWTHFYDPAFLAQSPELAQYFKPAERANVGGFSHLLYRRQYGPAVQWKGFCGGNKDASWLSQADLVGAFEHFGFRIVSQIVENNPNGTALLFVAEKRSG